MYNMLTTKFQVYELNSTLSDHPFNSIYTMQMNWLTNKMKATKQNLPVVLQWDTFNNGLLSCGTVFHVAQCGSIFSVCG